MKPEIQTIDLSTPSKVNNEPKWYRQAEISNVWTHALAFIFGLGAFHLLMQKSLATHDPQTIFACRVYGWSVLFTFLASTFYHALTSPRMKEAFRLLDHLLIYFMIAGTYTPFTLILFRDDAFNLALFRVIWLLALLGVIFKVLTMGKDRILSTILYLLLGWLGVLVIVPIMENLAPGGLSWLIAGGIIYTTGVFFYVLDNKMPFAHTIWHIMVILGASCHFICIYNYVL